MLRILVSSRNFWVRCLGTSLAILCSTYAYATATELSLFRPYAETSKHAPVIIESNQHGYCKQQSERIVREDAWHCVTNDGKTHDPCFSKRFSANTMVICPESPWSGKAIQMTINPPLDESSQVSLDMSNALPWAVELVSGERCLSVESKQIYDNLPVNYFCGNGVVLTGDAHRCSGVWTILKHDSSGVSMSDISRVWF